jgi:hypothetical protein
VLSPNLLCHKKNFIQTHPAPLNEAYHRANVMDDPHAPAVLFNLAGLGGCLNIRFGRPQVTLAILDAFFLPAELCAVICDASLCGTLPAVCGTAAEGATQVASLAITRFGNKENPAVPAPLEVIPKASVAAKDRPKGPVVG